MSLQKKLKDLILVLFFSLNLVIYSYVPCDDYVGCPDYRICCQASDGGYTCCYYTRVCCMNATRCCEKDSSLKFLIENWKNSISAEKASAFDTRQEQKVDGLYKNKNKENEPIKTDQAYLRKNYLDSVQNLFESRKFYDSFANLSKCEGYFWKFFEEIIKMYNDLWNIYYTKLNRKNNSNILKIFSEEFELAEKMIIECVEIKENFNQFLLKIKNNFNNPEVLDKFIKCLTKNEKEIKKKIKEIEVFCYGKKFDKCGKNLAELFFILFFLE